MPEKKLYGTVLIKADLILECLFNEAGSQSLQSVVRETGLTKSTALKILETLEHIGYVSRNNYDKTYSIGPKLIKYSNKQIERFDFDDIINKEIEDLYQAFDETLHVGVYQNDKIVTIKKFQSSKSVVCISSEIGETKDLYSSAMGKAVLAEMDDRQLFRYINQHDFVAKTDKTIASAQKLLSEVESIRSRGYSIDDEENEEGVYCIGVAITKMTGENKTIVGALSISIPIYRATDETVAVIATSVLNVKEKIMNKLN